MFPWGSNSLPTHHRQGPTSPSTAAYHQMPQMRQPISRSQARPQNYQTSPTSHNLSTLTSGPHSVSVVVTNRPLTTPTNASKSADGQADEGPNGSNITPQRSVGGVVSERDLFFVPMAGSGSNTTSNPGSSGYFMSGTGNTKARGTKRTRVSDMDMGINMAMNGDADDGEADIDGGNGDTPRKHGKRLTTREEVSLFEICNRHAENFGHRSNLCNWWKTVTAEFTRAHGHPYSWHSVRRKVELVSKQRLKFLDDQRARGGAATVTEDLSNPQWRAAIDAWIPTWQRWEEAEARRIEKRDSRSSRKRMDKDVHHHHHQHHQQQHAWDPWAAAGATEIDGNPSTSSPSELPTTDASLPVAAGSASSSASDAPLLPADAVVPVPAAASHPLLPPSSTQVSTVKLPPGFETMFSNMPSTQSPAPFTTTSPMQPDNRMVASLFQALDKLNKHLDAASMTADGAGRRPSSSSVISALVSASEAAVQNSASTAQRTSLQHASSIDVEAVKTELRQEMQAELRIAMERNAAIEEKLDSLQRTQEVILNMLRQDDA
ncbi:hypothetical protein N7510_003773 [Penicillium lagena]|uniref:uncharacterized protein n=1 Tax=Penicillium lagena TaxID=94218 RepID=UPI0025413735|nr:uncharacterized protein N7510_003773 [Penicillium lagena]KAJ5619789.1 hypothetical protein N7510_003773 [Penicillium lagena]